MLLSDFANLMLSIGEYFSPAWFSGNVWVFGKFFIEILGVFLQNFSLRNLLKLHIGSDHINLNFLGERRELEHSEIILKMNMKRIKGDQKN